MYLLQKINTMKNLLTMGETVRILKYDGCQLLIQPSPPPPPPPPPRPLMGCVVLRPAGDGSEYSPSPAPPRMAEPLHGLHE